MNALDRIVKGKDIIRFNDAKKRTTCPSARGLRQGHRVAPVNGLRETCHCGHDKATHFVDAGDMPPVVRTCLAGGCECKRYVNEWEPKPKVAKVPVRPKHPSWCRCADCKAYLTATGQSLDEEPPDPWEGPDPWAGMP